MERFDKLLKAGWERFWHCYYYTVKSFFTKDAIHRSETVYRGGLIVYIGCSCNKVWHSELTPEEIQSTRKDLRK